MIELNTLLKWKRMNQIYPERDLVDFCKLAIFQVGEPCNCAGLGQLGRLNPTHPHQVATTENQSETYDHNTKTVNVKKI